MQCIHVGCSSIYSCIPIGLCGSDCLTESHLEACRESLAAEEEEERGRGREKGWSTQQGLHCVGREGVLEHLWRL